MHWSNPLSFKGPLPLQLNWATFLPILKCLHCYRRARRLILWSWCFSHPNEEASPLFTTYVSKYGLLAVTVANESADPLLPTDFYCLVLEVQRFDRTTYIDLSSTKHSSLYLLAPSVYPTTYPRISYCHYITSPFLLTERRGRKKRKRSGNKRKRWFGRKGRARMSKQGNQVGSFEKELPCIVKPPPSKKRARLYVCKGL